MRQRPQAAQQQQHQIALGPPLLTPLTRTDLPRLRDEADLNMRHRALIKYLNHGRAELGEEKSLMQPLYWHTAPSWLGTISYTVEYTPTWIT